MMFTKKPYFHCCLLREIPFRQAMNIEESLAQSLILRLKEKLEDIDFPVRVIALGSMFQLATDKKYTQQIKVLLNNKRNVPLSPAALEVLAAVAYNEPVTRAYIEQVRGVDSSSIVSNLVEKELLCEAGRLDLPGKPIAYKTTPNFLRTFGLNDLGDLPNVEDEEDEKEEYLPEDFVDGQMGFDGEAVTI